MSPIGPGYYSVYHNKFYKAIFLREDVVKKRHFQKIIAEVIFSPVLTCFCISAGIIAKNNEATH